MKNLKVAFQKNKGFTLIEFILGFSLTTLLLSSIFMIFNYSTNISQMGNEMDEILLNGRYAVEYIKGEIMSADKIICSSKFNELNYRYPTNIGFVILHITKNNRTKDKYKYNYITYYVENNELKRIACEGLEDRYPKGEYFSGFNQVCTLMVDLSKTQLDTKNSLIYLHLTIGEKLKKSMDFKSTIYIRCPIEY